MSGKLTVTIVILIVLFISLSYIYVINNPIEISIQANIGSTETSTTSSSTTTTSSSTTTTIQLTTTSSSTTTTIPTTTTSSTTTSTTTTIPRTTTTIEVLEKEDSVAVNSDNSENIKIYEGEFISFDGFEGENQFLLDTLVQDLPEVYKQNLLEKISFINGCHLYGLEMLGECPFGVWDSVGTFKNGDTNADWKL